MTPDFTDTHILQHSPYPDLGLWFSMFVLPNTSVLVFATFVLTLNPALRPPSCRLFISRCRL